MTCRELHEFLMDYLCGELPDEQRAHFDHHLGICPSCVAYLDSYRETVALGKDAFAVDDLATDAPSELIEAILASRSEEA